MIRIECKLLPEGEGGNEQVIAESNADAKRSSDHLRYLIGNKKCRKHPSNNNKIRVLAVMGGNPKMEIVNLCCTDFYKRLGR